MKLYFRIVGQNGTYILTAQEMNLALDRENNGVEGIVAEENEYGTHNVVEDEFMING